MKPIYFETAAQIECFNKFINGTIFVLIKWGLIILINLKVLSGSTTLGIGRTDCGLLKQVLSGAMMEE
jgi:hypothetical protein